MQGGPASCAGPFLLAAGKSQLVCQKIKPCHSDSACSAEPVLSEAEGRAEESQSPPTTGDSHRSHFLHGPGRSKSQEVRIRASPCCSPVTSVTPRTRSNCV